MINGEASDAKYGGLPAQQGFPGVVPSGDQVDSSEVFNLQMPERTKSLDSQSVNLWFL